VTEQGWIKTWRKLQQWEWYQDSQMVHFWIHCLLSANHKNKNWQGVELLPGQFISGRLKLASETGLSEQTIRTCINRLKSTGELTSKSTNKFTVYTIVNWKLYQPKDNSTNQQINQMSNQQSTSNQPAINQQLTTNKNVKNEKNEKNNTLSLRFEKWWQNYPRKESRKKAEERFLALTEIKRLECEDKTPGWLNAHKTAGTPIQYIPHPTTFLNQERWNDDVSVILTKHSEINNKANEDEEYDMKQVERDYENLRHRVGEAKR